MRKGQMEIMGFLVIIILLIVGGLIYLNFALKEDTGTLEDAVVILSLSDMMSSMEQYTVCEDTSLGDVMEACESNSKICDQDSCKLMENQIEGIMDAYGWESDEYVLKVGDFYTFGACSGSVLYPNPKQMSGFEFNIGACM